MNTYYKTNIKITYINVMKSFMVPEKDINEQQYCTVLPATNFNENQKIPISCKGSQFASD